MQDADAHFVRLGRGDLDVLDNQVLARAPAHGGLAGDGLSSGVGHRRGGESRRRISEEKLDRQAIVIVSAPRVLLVIDPGSLLIIHPTVSSSVTMTSVCDSACDRCGRVRLASDVAAGAGCGRAWGHLTGQQSTMQ